MKRKYKDIHLRPASLALIDQANQIIDAYTADGYRLTLRQLYYQLVTRNLITNEERSYKRLSGLITDARYAGLVDWDAIEDRVRQPRAAPEFTDLKDLVETALQSYRLPRWEGQFHYVELWVEKEALAGVLDPIARKWHVTLMVNKGYSSASAMKDAADRFNSVQRVQNFNPDRLPYYRPNNILLYLGDHDPSGEDMVRDISARLGEFGAKVDVRKVALTIDQVREYGPPPNPAKLTDPRADAYIAEFGGSSWEVDALPPKVLNALIEHELGRLINQVMYDAVIEREAKDKEALRQVTEGLLR